HENDRYGPGALLHRPCGGRRGDQDHVSSEAHQLLGRCTHAVGIAAGKANVELDAAALRPAPFSVPACRCSPLVPNHGIVLGPGMRTPGAPQAIGRLRACRKRPRRCAAEAMDELPPSHSITSSARSRNNSGIARPIDLAVFMLTTSSNRVGN